MNEYNFEYSDHRYTLKLLGICFLLGALLMAGMFIVIHYINIFLALAIVMGIPILIFWLNQKQIKKRGIAIIHDLHTEFFFPTSNYSFTYLEIITYQVEYYNGISLSIKFKNGKNFKLQANSSFCNPSELEYFCTAFESKLSEFKAANNTGLTRKKPILAKPWFLLLLIISSASILVVAAIALIQGKDFPPVFFGTLGTLLTLWAGYSQTARSRRSRPE